MSDTNTILAICIKALEEIAESIDKSDENGINADIAAEALQRIKQLEKVELYYNHIERKET